MATDTAPTSLLLTCTGTCDRILLLLLLWDIMGMGIRVEARVRLRMRFSVMFGQGHILPEQGLQQSFCSRALLVLEEVHNLVGSQVLVSLEEGAREGVNSQQKCPFYPNHVAAMQ